MSVLFLQGPYSFFFRDIAENLETQGVRCLALAYNLGDRYLYRGIKTIDVHSEILRRMASENTKPESYVEKVPNLFAAYKRKVLRERITDSEKKYFATYVRLLEELIHKENVRLMVMHNDLRWQHALAIDVAKRLGIKYVVFELGLFRPNYITVDCQGVNYNNSVPRDPDFYKNRHSLPSHTVGTESASGSVGLRKDLIFASYLLLHRLGEVVNVNCPAHKPMSIMEYLLKFLKRYKSTQVDFCTRPQSRSPYIFAPFQVTTDSQVLIHSDFNDMYQFAEVVIAGVEKYNSRYPSRRLSIIFKEHPMDIGKVDYSGLREKYSRYDWIQILENGDTNQLIKGSELVITINSTVGIEALERGKRVICLGRAFYAIPGIAVASTTETLPNDIAIALNNEVDEDLLRNFLAFLRYEYQVPGNEYTYSHSVVTRIADRIREEAET